MDFGFLVYNTLTSACVRLQESFESWLSVMLVGIISDTHDNINAIQMVQNFFLQNDVNYLFHCGDLTDPAMAAYLGGFNVVFVMGNMDSANERIRQVLDAQNPQNWTGWLYTGFLLDTTIAAVHGNVEGQIETLIHSQKYDYLFHGHTHVRRDHRYGRTRVINPGPLGGMRSAPGSICMLDLETDEAVFFSVSTSRITEL